MLVRENIHIRIHIYLVEAHTHTHILAPHNLFFSFVCSKSSIQRQLSRNVDPGI